MKVLLRFQVSALILFSIGCASVPYKYGVPEDSPPYTALASGEAQVETGRPNWFIDGLGWIFSIPHKIILLDISVGSRRIDAETVDFLAEYLEENGLNSVKVRVNQYAPLGEWRRLRGNHSVGAGWRWTFGSLYLLVYTVFPERVFGSDNYNPFTHTINLYSDNVPIALHEGGHAKDLAGRKHRGTYAVARILPLVALYHESAATGDAIGYLKDKKKLELEKRSYKILYPAYGTYVGNEILQFYGRPDSIAIYLGAVLCGHVTGRVKAWRTK